MTPDHGETVDLTLDPPPLVEYRLTWDMCEPQMVDYMVSRHGRDVWALMNEKQWSKIRWMRTSRTSFDLVDLADQRAQLQSWAESRVEPIRNVQLQRRSVHLSQWDDV